MNPSICTQSFRFFWIFGLPSVPCECALETRGVHATLPECTESASFLHSQLNTSIILSAVSWRIVPLYSIVFDTYIWCKNLLLFAYILQWTFRPFVWILFSVLLYTNNICNPLYICLMWYIINNFKVNIFYLIFLQYK